MKAGYVHSIQSLGTVDGPGVRFVVFMQGCNLRCGCCHNPDTWDISGGESYSASALSEKAEKYRTYLGEKGGVTVSGGEPLLQAEFVSEFFRACHEKGIHTCLDTSGCILNDVVKELLSHTDRVLLDMKYTNEEAYRKYVGCSMEGPLAFLDYLNEVGIPTTLRQVIIPSLNDTAENITALSKISEKHPCVDKIELLPFRKICMTKYDKMGIPFPFADMETPTKEKMEYLESILKDR